MEIDIVGRIRNTKLAYRNNLQPLFEAVINSFQSIEESSERQEGRVQILLHRGGQLQIPIDEACKSHLPVKDFEIIDNGNGFDEKNFDSFLTADSTFKQLKGGKGVGRFTWLKAFDHAHVESVFVENGGKWLRSFDFQCTKNGIENHHCKEAKPDEPIATKVFLKDFCNFSITLGIAQNV